MATTFELLDKSTYTGYDTSYKYFSVSISDINTILQNGVPHDKLITSVKINVNVSFTFDGTGYCKAKYTYGFGKSNSITSPILGVTDIHSGLFGDKSASANDTSDNIVTQMASPTYPFDLGTKYGSHLTVGIQSDNVQSKTLNVDSVTLTVDCVDAVYVSYDSIFSFKQWADKNLSESALMAISDVSNTGFTGTALVDDAFTVDSQPVISVIRGREYTVEFETSYPSLFQLYVFFTDANGIWDGTLETLRWVDNATSLTFAPTTDYITIRVDITGAGNVIAFNNFRIYPTDYPYMSNSVAASERTDVSFWSMPTPTRDHYAFKGWNTKPDGSGIAYTSSSAFPTSDLVLYSQWEWHHDYSHIETFEPTEDSGGYTRHTCACGDFYDDNFTYMVRWFNEDGTAELERDASVPYGETPSCGVIPTKPATAQHSYEFIGWQIDTVTEGTVDLAPVVKSISYYARFKVLDNTYKVTWKNDDGTVLETDYAVYGTPPDYNGDLPKKASTAQFEYKFLGWSTEVDETARDEDDLDEVTGHIDYTAVYLPIPREYTVKVIVGADGIGGTVTKPTSGTYGYDSALDLEITPAFGYELETVKVGKLLGEGDEELYFGEMEEADYDKDSVPKSIDVKGNFCITVSFKRIQIPIFTGKTEPVTGVYIVPTTKTITYITNGTIPTLESPDYTVNGWKFEVSNSIPNDGYILEKLYINNDRIY